MLLLILFMYTFDMACEEAVGGLGDCAFLVALWTGIERRNRCSSSVTSMCGIGSEERGEGTVIMHTFTFT